LISSIKSWVRPYFQGAKVPARWFSTGCATLSLGLKIHAGLRRATWHVPGKGAQMARYYGWCSNKMRGMCQRGRPPELALPRPGVSPPPPLKLPQHPTGSGRGAPVRRAVPSRSPPRHTLRPQTPATTPKSGRKLPRIKRTRGIDTAAGSRQVRHMSSETQEQFSIARTVLSKGGRAKNKSDFRDSMLSHSL